MEPSQDTRQTQETIKLAHLIGSFGCVTLAQRATLLAAVDVDPDLEHGISKELRKAIGSSQTFAAYMPSHELPGRTWCDRIVKAQRTWGLSSGVELNARRAIKTLTSLIRQIHAVAKKARSRVVAA